MNSRKSLLFIPDISGFTEFVNQTEISHSRHIISELLELIIDSDELLLTVSEIEGDAVLFFKPEKIPTVDEILKQPKRTFLNFHNHLKKYESQRICSCGACSSTSDLSLKFIVHQGNIETIKVKDSEKLYGPDVILAHRLMKNNIVSHEYVLLTNSFFENENTLNEDWVEWKSGNSEYENSGKVTF